MSGFKLIVPSWLYEQALELGFNVDDLVVVDGIKLPVFVRPQASCLELRRRRGKGEKARARKAWRR